MTTLALAVLPVEAFAAGGPAPEAAPRPAPIDTPADEPRPAPASTLSTPAAAPGQPRPVSTSADPACPPNPVASRPAGSRVRRRIEDSPFRRTGFALGVAVGASGCSGNKDWCRGTSYFAYGVPNLAGEVVGAFATESRTGPGFMLEVGYRPARLIEVVAFAQSAYRPQQVNVPQGAVVDQVVAFDVGGGLAAMVRPLAYSRFDPFVGLGLGGALHRVRLRFTSDEDIERTFEERISRLLVRASVGLNVYVIERLSLGPRFDYDFFAAGRVCTDMQRVDPTGASTSSRECQSAREIAKLDQVDGLPGPAGQLPQFWRVSLDLRTYF